MGGVGKGRGLPHGYVVQAMLLVELWEELSGMHGWVGGGRSVAAMTTDGGGRKQMSTSW